MSFVIFVGSIGMYAVMPKGTEDAADNDVSIMLEYPDEIPFTKVQDEVLEFESTLMEQSDGRRSNSFPRIESRRCTV